MSISSVLLRKNLLQLAVLVIEVVTIRTHCTRGSAWNKQKGTKENTHYNWVLVERELFNTAANDFDA